MTIISSNDTPPPITIQELAERIKINKERGHTVTLLIGAGCSVSGGVPSTSQMVDMIKDFYPLAYDRAVQSPQAPKGLYQECIHNLTRYQRHDLFARCVREAKINAAYMCIASLMKQGYVNRVMNVNFDDLIIRACAIEHIFPAVYDLTVAPSTADYASLHIAAIYYLHGQISGLLLRNTLDEVKEQSDVVRTCFDFDRDRDLWIVAGYSGKNDPIFTDHIAQAKQFQKGLYWLPYTPKEPEDDVRKTLFQSDKSAYLLEPSSADEFFYNLTLELEIPPPALIAAPFSYLSMLLNNFAEQRPLLDNEDRYSIDHIRKQVRGAAERNGEDPHRVLEAKDALALGRNDRVMEIWTVADAQSRDELKNTAGWACIHEGHRLREFAKRSAGAITKDLLRQAETKYEQAHKIWPDMHEAIHYSATTLAEMAALSTGAEQEELYKKAIQKYLQAFDLCKHDYRMLNDWAGILAEWAQQKPDQEGRKLNIEAIRKCKQALRINPDDDTALLHWGIALCGLADFHHGVKQQRYLERTANKYKRCMQINPGQYQAIHNWAIVYNKLALTKQGEEAERLWEKACDKFHEACSVQLDAYDSLVGWGNALDGLASLKDEDEAKKLLELACLRYREANWIHPDNPLTLGNWGIALLHQSLNSQGSKRLQLLREAYDHLNKAENFKPGFFAYNLACVAALRGYGKECREKLEASFQAGRLPTRSFIDQDPSFVSFHGQVWFNELLQKATP